jgi:HAD superfamily hydrolase (TIGR01490 family)
VDRLLVSSERAHRVADYLVSRAPRGDRARELAHRLARQRSRLEFLRRYYDLYIEYARCELRFSDVRTMALEAGLHPADREVFRFDTGAIDWDHYLGDVHCAAVAEPVRVFEDLRKASPRKQPRPAPVEGAAAVAFFDMDGTLLSSNVVETYLWMRLQELGDGERYTHLGRIASRLPSLVRLERHDRSEFLRRMYREYAGARMADLERIVDEVLSAHVLSRLSPAGVRRVREHRAAGQRTVLLTGAIRPLTRPLAELFDHIEAAELSVDRSGVCTGFLDLPPLVGESRAAWMRHWAEQEGVDLSTSFAYADSHSDLPMLSAVGNPVAVRPDIPLFRHAKKNRWPIVDWASPAGTSRTLDPARGLR